ncbi:MAG: hypothetical protein ACLPT4_06760 [Verrucomicrobiia bacterium]
MSIASILTEPMREAIARSGYLMEQRLVPIIEQHGFKATPNERFRDPDSGELREIDVFAISGERIRDSDHDFVFPILLVACKNLQCPLVFFTQQEVKLRWFLGEVEMSGLPLQVRGRGGKVEAIAESLGVEEFHHYYRSGRIASQFCAVYENKKANPPVFEAGHTIGGRIELFKDFDGLAKAVLSEKREHGDSFYLDRTRESLNLQIYYPVFLTAGTLVECHMGKGKPRYRQVHRVGFLYRTSIGNKKRDIRIDVVDEIGLKPLLRVIEQETSEIAGRIRRKEKVVTQSLDWITKRLRRWKPERQKAYVAGELLD